MPKSNSRSKRVAPIVCAIVVITLVMSLVGVFAFGAAVLWMESAVLTVCCIVYALLYIGIVIGVIAALCQRLREIDGGEEDEASQY